MKNKYSFLLYALGTIFLLSSCIKENHFGKSSLKQILYFSLNGQTGNARIVEDSLLIYIKVTADAEVTALSIDSIALTTFVTLSPDPVKAQDFSDPFIYIVTAEDGSTAMYTIMVEQEGSNPQLENSGFDEWYTPEGKSYQQPGSGSGTIWASANDGVTTNGAGNFNTTPLLISGTDCAAKLITKDLRFIAQIVGQRMGSATLFVGKFVLNISNPTASAQFGTPFTAKPKSFTIDYNYVEGSPYKDGTNKTLNKKDSADLYVLLENRKDPNVHKRIATGWLRAGESANTNFKTLNLPIIYGTLPAGTPEYKKPITVCMVPPQMVSPIFRSYLLPVQMKLFTKVRWAALYFSTILS